METAEWGSRFKFNLGEFVTPIVMDGTSHPTKMVVISRGMEEFADHWEKYYLCAHYKLGDYIRQRVYESEVVVWGNRD